MIWPFIAAALYALFVAVVPGVRISIKDVAPPRGVSIDTGTWFVLGTSEQGPTSPVLIRSMQEFVDWFGARASYSVLYDALDAFFHEGGRQAYVSRVVGPAATASTLNLLDAGAAVSLVASAIGPGVYGDSIKVGVVAGGGAGTFQIQVADSANTVLEQSPDLADQNAAVVWASNSQYIRLTLGVSVNDPAVVALTALAGGDDDRANITDTERQAALDLFTKDLGPGQVSFPGSTAASVHAMLGQHAADMHRLALVDFQDTSSVATLVTAADADRTNGRWMQVVAPWAIVPGYVDPNTTRYVPYSAIQAGIYARNDVTRGVNVAAAGDAGISVYSTGLSQSAWSETDRGTLNDAGVNVAIIRNGRVKTYGERSLVAATSDPTWAGIGGARLLGVIAFRAEDILEAHMFEEIDGRGRLFSRVRGQLVALCNEFFTLGSLYGATPDEAFVVVCDDTNNTPQTIANRELHAAIGLRVSESAELVYLDLVRVPVSQSLAA